MLRDFLNRIAQQVALLDGAGLRTKAVLFFVHDKKIAPSRFARLLRIAKQNFHTVLRQALKKLERILH